MEGEGEVERKGGRGDQGSETNPIIDNCVIVAFVSTVKSEGLERGWEVIYGKSRSVGEEEGGEADIK